MFFHRKLKKLNQEATEEYIKSLEETNAKWRDLAHDYAHKYWELKAKEGQKCSMTTHYEMTDQN